MKKIITFFFVTSVITVSAHEFWLQPNKFMYRKGEKANIRFLVGENFKGENWSGSRAKVQSLDVYQEKSVTSIANLLSDHKGDSILLPLHKEGTMMATFNSNNSFIELEPAVFNAYLEEDGLTEALEYRNKHKESGSKGKEFYQRSVKTIFQVGRYTDNTFSRETNLPLDIIPLKNPYLLRQNDSLTVKILFQKKPLADHKVRLWQMEKGKLMSRDLVTAANGEISFSVGRSGRWMVSCVNMKHLEKDLIADWQSYWASCTWGYE